MTPPLDTPRHPRAKAGPDAEAVAAYLRANPGFLAQHPALYATLTPPRRVHGEVLADHMAAQIAAARAEITTARAQATSVLTAGRAASGMAARVQEAVLLILAAARAGQPIGAVVAAELPAALAVDAAHLCAEAPAADDIATLPPGAVTIACDKRAVRFTTGTADHPALHGAAAALAETGAVVRIPGHPPMLLALAARADAGALDPVQGSGALAFLGRAIATALGR